MLECLKAGKPDGFIGGREQNMGTRGVNIGFGVKSTPKAQLMLLRVCRMCKLADVCKTFFTVMKHVLSRFYRTNDQSEQLQTPSLYLTLEIK